MHNLPSAVELVFPSLGLWLVENSEQGALLLGMPVEPGSVTATICQYSSQQKSSRARRIMEAQHNFVFLTMMIPMYDVSRMVAVIDCAEPTSSALEFLSKQLPCKSDGGLNAARLSRKHTPTLDSHVCPVLDCPIYLPTTHLLDLAPHPA